MVISFDRGSEQQVLDLVLDAHRESIQSVASGSGLTKITFHKWATDSREECEAILCRNHIDFESIN